MKTKLPVWLSVVIALVLVAFGLLYGTWAGYCEDRAEVNALLTMENGLMDVLSYRGADGHNLCVVAGRHLTDDPDVAALSQTAAILTDATQPLQSKKAANDQLDASVQAVKTKLLETESFQQSHRDQQYLAMLEGDLKNLTATDKVSLYNQAAQGFNDQLAKGIPGWIASVLGVKPCELYQ
jgi:hypothetical protein